MRVLITGAGGFVGRHLTAHLVATTPDIDLHGTVFGASEAALDGAVTHQIDLRDEAAVCALIAELKPDAIYHLAGQAFVPRSFEAPWETLEVNIRAQLNLFLGCLACKLAPRILITASAEIYGAAQHMPITEDAPLLPSSPYSVSKVAQDLLGYQYHLSHGLPVLRARAFNHFGPGQDARFVAPAFAMQIARIEAGLQPPVLQVGDLTAQRDFTDVRDIVRAYQLLLTHGDPGVAYNIASGQAHSIQRLLGTLLEATRVPIDIQV
ncbi:MAG: GDP-mannose 4,6-dehydratase, partial [Armatimonadetes bacterium]|nr:GDP-mannose 4,6-dehydratase [Anaerolineae bacterium]